MRESEQRNTQIQINKWTNRQFPNEVEKNKVKRFEFWNWVLRMTDHPFSLACNGPFWKGSRTVIHSHKLKVWKGKKVKIAAQTMESLFFLFRFFVFRAAERKEGKTLSFFLFSKFSLLIQSQPRRQTQREKILCRNDGTGKKEWKILFFIAEVVIFLSP